MSQALQLLMTKKKLAKRFTNLKASLVKKNHKKLSQFFLAGAFLVLCFSCQSRSEKLYAQAYEKINQNQFAEAIELLESCAELEKDNLKKMKALLESARLLRFETQNYEQALKVLRIIVLESSDSKMRMLAQESIAEIYFDHLQNNTEALKEFLILEPLLQESKKKELVRLKIAQAQRFLGNNQAALEYIEVSLKNNSENKNSFLKLKAQILQAEQKYDEALKAYDTIFLNTKSYFISENLFSAVSSIQEEKKDYKQAIEYLEKNAEFISDKNYLEFRIKKFKEKQINKPFSKGIRK